MKKQSTKVLPLAIALLTLQACAPTTQTPNISGEMAQKEARLQRELAVKGNMKAAQRLANVSAPILIKNAELCGDLVAPYLGTELGTKANYPKDYQETMANLYGVGEYPTVTMVANKTPAAGRLRVGDMVTHANGQVLTKGKKSLTEINKVIAETPQNQSLALTVDRNGVPQNITVKPVLACDSPVRLASSDAVNAFADGKSIGVTKGMIRFVENDTELATVIGHELAHNTREHMSSKRGNAIIGGILGAALSVAIGVNVTDLGAQLGAGANSQGFESEADYVGLYHTARAGYNIADAPNLWRRMAASNPGAIHIAGGSHPSTAKRFLSLEAAVKEINAKKAAGKRLVPEEREVVTHQSEERKPGGNG